MCYTSNERHCFTLFTDVCNSRNIYEIEEMHTQMFFFGLYFSIVHISTNIVLKDLKCRVAVGEIRIEGTVSQNLVLGLSFYFMQKNG